ncbi:hypothetical protein, partial [Klebsiella pneumoniae]|uniref:hypothetical protein n=1 Tax=Klebsiella pneumoniae TaxID=573 RepID=UPI0027313441
VYVCPGCAGVTSSGTSSVWLCAVKNSHTVCFQMSQIQSFQKEASFSLLKTGKESIFLRMYALQGF